MVVGKLIWAAVCTALAFGLNHQLRPQFEAAYERTEAPDATGNLTLWRAGVPLELPSRSAHVVVADLWRFGKKFSVREVSLRSVAAAGAAPGFELFAALPDDALVVPEAPPALGALRGRDLAVRDRGRLGARPSFLRRTVDGPSRVIAGNLRFTDIRPAPHSPGGRQSYIGEARLELQVESEHGVELLTGRWTGALYWH